MPPTHTLVSAAPVAGAAPRTAPDGVDGAAEHESDDLATARGMVLGAALGLVSLAAIAGAAFWLL
jgi:hypothetical protein